MIEHLSSVKFPFLLIGSSFEDIRINKIGVDNRKGAKTAMEYLYRMGHRRIALFMDDLNKRAHLERFNGYIEIMQKYGLPISQSAIKNTYTEPAAAFDLAREMMMEKDAGKRPTAVFAISDWIATQVIMGVQSLGYSVPRDLSVIGFDSQQIFDNGYRGLPLTSIKQPLFEIGRDSIDILTGILEGRLETPYTRTYETQLIKGETVRGISLV
jgi:DNA-binding LacI/PurR family transcriptional regulator